MSDHFQWHIIQRLRSIHIHKWERSTATSHFTLLLLLFCPTCFASGMCREATCVNRNVTGDAALRPSVCQPPVIRTVHMKAAADKTEQRGARERGKGNKRKKTSEMEDWVLLSSHVTLLFAFHSSKVSAISKPALRSPLLHLTPA